MQNINQLFDICENGYNMNEDLFLTIFTESYQIENFECSICCDKFNDVLKIKCPSGIHFLDRNCALECFSRNMECPFCRYNFEHDFDVFIKDKIDRFFTDYIIQGGDLNIKNEDGDLPLNLAIYYNRGTIFKKLLALGANPNIPDGSGNWPIILAYLSRFENITYEDHCCYLCRILDFNPDPNVVDSNGNGLIHHMIERNDNEKIFDLMVKGVKFNYDLVNGFGETPLGISVKNENFHIFSNLLKRAKYPYIGEVIYGNSPIGMGVILINNIVTFINFYLEFVKKIGYRYHQNYHMQNDLHLCIENNKFQFLRFLVRYIKQNIPNNSLFFSSRNAYGETPIMAATRVGSLESIQLLFNNKSEIYIKDNFGKNALEIAKLHKHKHIVQYFEKEFI